MFGVYLCFATVSRQMRRNWTQFFRHKTEDWKTEFTRMLQFTFKMVEAVKRSGKRPKNLFGIWFL